MSLEVQDLLRHELTFVREQNELMQQKDFEVKKEEFGNNSDLVADELKKLSKLLSSLLNGELDSQNGKYISQTLNQFAVVSDLLDANKEQWETFSLSSHSQSDTASVQSDHQMENDYQRLKREKNDLEYEYAEEKKMWGERHRQDQEIISQLQSQKRELRTSLEFYQGTYNQHSEKEQQLMKEIADLKGKWEQSQPQQTGLDAQILSSNCKSNELQSSKSLFISLDPELPQFELNKSKVISFNPDRIQLESTRSKMISFDPQDPKLESTKSEMISSRNEFSQYMNHLREEYEESKRQMENKCQNQIAEDRERHEQELNALRMVHQKEIDALKKSKLLLLTEVSTEINHLRSIISQLSAGQQ